MRMCNTRINTYATAIRVALALMLVLIDASCAKHLSDSSDHAASRNLSDAEVLNLSDHLSNIYKEHDWSGLKKLVSSGYVGTAPGFQWTIADLEKEFPKISLHDIHRDAYFIKVLNPALVLLNEDATLKETYDGQDISGPYRMTTIWTKQGDAWQLLFEQEIPIPVSANVPAQK